MDRSQLLQMAKEKMAMEQQGGNANSRRDALLQAAKEKMAMEQGPEDGLLTKIALAPMNAGLAVAKPVLEHVVAPIGSFVDRFTGAPTRAAIGAAQEGENPISAFTHQFGGSPEDAPTGKELAGRAGMGNTPLSEAFPSMYSPSGKEFFKLQKGGLLDPTAEGVAGMGLDVVADPTNLIPAGAVAKGVQGLAKPAMKVAGQVAKGTGKAIQGLGHVADAATGIKFAENAGLLAQDAATYANKMYESGKGVVKGALEPKVLDSYSDDLITASKAGLRPEDLMESARVGHGQVSSRLERSIAEGPRGSELYNKWKRSIDKLEYEADNILTKHSGGPIHDPLAAGEKLKDSYTSQLNKILDDSTVTYKKAADLSPNLQITPKSATELNTLLNGMEKRAKGMILRGTPEQEAIGNNLLKFSKKMRASKGNYRHLSEQVGYIGKAAYENPNLDKVYAKELKDLYKGVAESLKNTVDDIHPALGKDLKDFNEKITEFNRTKDAVGKSIQTHRSNPESLFKSIAGDANKIEALKKMLPVEDFNAFRGSYLNSLMKRNSDGILWESSLKSLEKNRGRLKRMFSAGEIKELEDVLALGKRQGNIVLSTSGTGGSNIFRNMKEGILSGMTNQAVLDEIKSRAGLLSKKTTPKVPPIKAPVKVAPAKGLLGLPKRGPVENRLKATQSIAPQYYRDEENNGN